MTVSSFAVVKCGYGYSTHPRTGSLYAFLSFKVLFCALPFLVLESAGTAILHASDGQFVCIFIVQTAILTFSKDLVRKCGYGYFTSLRQALCRVFYDISCVFRGGRPEGLKSAGTGNL